MKTTIVQVSDDLDDSTEDVQTVSLIVNGVEYEVDLGPKNRSKLDKALEPYLSAGRRVGGRKRRSSSSTAGGPSTSDLRAWAAENGYEVSGRGRISAQIRQAYDEAH